MMSKIRDKILDLYEVLEEMVISSTILKYNVTDVKVNDKGTPIVDVNIMVNNPIDNIDVNIIITK